MAQILLITGIVRSYVRPIGAYQVANILRSEGYSVQVADFFPNIIARDFNDVLKIIKRYVGPETIWVGFSSTFILDLRGNGQNETVFDIEQFCQMRDLIKEINPKTKVLLGGGKTLYTDTVNAHMRKEIKKYKNLDTFDCSNYIDCYVEGYSECRVVPITKFLEGKNPFLQYEKNNDGSISINDDHKASNFDFTNHKFVWQPEDHIFQNEALPIEIARGCIFNCSFCSFPLNGKKKLDYLKNPQILIEQFIENYEKFGTTNYVYLDDTHNDSPQKLEILYNQVYSKLPFKIRFGTYLRLDLLAAHPHTIPLLKESGLGSGFFGIESLNYESAKSIGKGLKPERAIETLHRLREEWPDVTMQAGFIVGLPHETEESVTRWLDMITEPAFPLDSINLEVLRLFPNIKKLWYSDMDQNIGKYEYTFDEKGQWTNNMGLTEIRSREIRQKYFEKYLANGKAKVGWTGLFSLLNLGIPFEEARNHSEYETKKYRHLNNARMQEYTRKILR